MKYMKGIRGIYRPKRQRTSGQRGVRPVVLTKRSKGCLVHLGINQRVFQKVAYVWYFGIHPLYDLQGVRLVVPHCMSALQKVAYVRHT